MAIRNAIESYSLFVESTTQVTDFQLSTDLVNTISTGQVKAVKILKRLESGRKLCYTIEGLVEPQDLRTAIKEYMTSKSSDLQLQDNGWISILSSLTSEEPSPIIEGKMWKTLTVAIRFLKYTKATQVEEEAVVGSVIGEVIKKLRAAGEKINSKIYVKRFASDYHFKIFVTFFNKNGIPIKEDGNYIPAGEKNEAVPGEIDYLNFDIPDGATAWKLWVPK